MKKSVVAALFAGLFARWGTAWLDEIKPVFPRYYYTDAQKHHDGARQAVAHWRDPAEPLPIVEPAARIYTTFTAALYRAFGPHPLWPKLANGLISTAAAYCWYRIALLFLPQSSALLALWLLALWPSSVFFGGQNLKDPHVWLLSAACIWIFSRHWTSLEKEAFALRDQRLPAAGAVLLFMTALYRPQMLLLLALSLCVAVLPLAFRPNRSGAQSAGLGVSSLWILGAALLYRPLSPHIFSRILDDKPISVTNPASQVSLAPAIAHPDRPGVVIRPWSPQGLSEFRRLRQSQDQWWAEHKMNRRIKTQILPEARFETWLDVALFLPQGAFYALFMPLPGLYPTEGKLGRLLASLENVALLALFLLALGFWLRERPTQPVPWALAAFFILTATAYGLFEFDLGSAMRHRVQYFPCVFLFAAGLLDRRTPRRRQAA